jgi:hypothetical protein
MPSGSRATLTFLSCCPLAHSPEFILRPTALLDTGTGLGGKGSGGISNLDAHSARLFFCETGCRGTGAQFCPNP